MKRTSLVLAMGVCAALSLGGAVQAADPSATPEDFVAQVAVTNATKVEAAKLALKRSKSEDVKAFALQVIDDNTKARTDLKSLALQKNVQDYNDSPVIPGPGDDLTGLSDDSFDAAYARNQLKASEQAVEEYSRALEASTDPDVQNFARNNLRVQKLHLELARELARAHASK